MGKLFDAATSEDALYKAWLTIRSNGLASSSFDTRSAVETFDQATSKNIRAMCRLLHKDEFKFDPQTGVTKKKASGSVRGIVMASVRNRVVERSLLNTLQSRVPFVRQVIERPTSVGGVPDRSVPHGLKLIRDAFNEGNLFFARSDIRGFFDNVPRLSVIDKLIPHLEDAKLISLLKQATAVTLANEKFLKEDRKAFPTDEQGVAQGSPLSPLFGNLLLDEFDNELNRRGITCVRFIDDFILLGAKESHVRLAFEAARTLLLKYKLECHDPYSGKVEPDKGSRGHAANGFVFLGYDIRPGLFQPSEKSRKKFLLAINTQLGIGRRSIVSVRRSKNSWDAEQRYAQTLVGVDRVIRGWGNAFAYSNAHGLFCDIDRQIDSKLDAFRNWFRRQSENADPKERRRIGGVGLLEDVQPKNLDDAPFRFGSMSRFRDARTTVSISTDGAAISSKRRRDPGPAGWGFVVHATGEKRSASVERATNNEMELRAVYEALVFVPVGGSVKIYTDSRYVEQTINAGGLVKYHSELWKAVRSEIDKRRVKVIWVRGHAGDQFNIEADALANAAAQHAKEARSKSAM